MAVKVCSPQVNTAETVSYTWGAANAQRSLQQTRINRFRSLAGSKDTSCFAMTTESLSKEYPLYATSLFNLIKNSESRIDRVR